MSHIGGHVGGDALRRLHIKEQRLRDAVGDKALTGRPTQKSCVVIQEQPSSQAISMPSIKTKVRMGSRHQTLLGAFGEHNVEMGGAGREPHAGMESAQSS